MLPFSLWAAAAATMVVLQYVSVWFMHTGETFSNPKPREQWTGYTGKMYQLIIWSSLSKNIKDTLILWVALFSNWGFGVSPILSFWQWMITEVNQSLFFFHLLHISCTHISTNEPLLPLTCLCVTEFVWLGLAGCQFTWRGSSSESCDEGKRSW